MPTTEGRWCRAILVCFFLQFEDNNDTFCIRHICNLSDPSGGGPCNAENHDGPNKTVSSQVRRHWLVVCEGDHGGTVAKDAAHVKIRIADLDDPNIESYQNTMCGCVDYTVSRSRRNFSILDAVRFLSFATNGQRLPKV